MATETLRVTQFALDHLADPVYWVRSDGRIVYANEAACRSLGYSHEELVLMSVPDIDPGVSWSLWPAQWQKMKDAGHPLFHTGFLLALDLLEIH